MADHNEIQRIATAMNALRPAWPINSLVTFLGKHRARPFRDLAIAAVVVATDERTTTPNLLNKSGPWWKAAQEGTGATSPEVGPGREPRCTVYGHDYHPARTCTACRAEHLATGTWPTGTTHQDAPRGLPADYEDTRTRAANDHGDKR